MLKIRRFQELENCKLLMLKFTAIMTTGIKKHSAIHDYLCHWDFSRSHI